MNTDLNKGFCINIWKSKNGFIVGPFNIDPRSPIRLDESVVFESFEGVNKYIKEQMEMAFRPSEKEKDAAK